LNVKFSIHILFGKKLNSCEFVLMIRWDNSSFELNEQIIVYGIITFCIDKNILPRS
jgi:hypothetical protein